MSTQGPLTPGAVVDGTWHVDLALGGGGMGTVYACTHVRNGLRVALKVLHAHAAREPALRARFLSEGRALNRVDHPGVVKALGDGALDGCPYLVMELALGRSLRHLAAERGEVLTPATLRPLVDELLAALDAVHAAGIVHRDVKPDNVIVTHDGHVKLVDFGIARVDASGETSTGTVLGTAAYMAPEQVLGKHGLVDGRADVFSVGAVLFRLLSGKAVHHGVGGMELLIAMGTRRAPSLRTVMPSVDRALADVVDRALAFDRKDRYPTAGAMRAAWAAAFDPAARVAASRRRSFARWGFVAACVALAGLAVRAALLLTRSLPRADRQAADDDEPSTSDRSAGTAKPASSTVCELDVTRFADYVEREGSDLRLVAVIAMPDTLSATGFTADNGAAGLVCASTRCFRSAGPQVAHAPSSTFRTRDVPWKHFRRACITAEASFRAEHGRRGHAQYVSFDQLTTAARWSFTVSGPKATTEFCFTPDAKPIACAGGRPPPDVIVKPCDGTDDLCF